MTCPICNQKIDPSDHSEKWGPEFAHSRCVIAFTAGSAIQDAKLQDRIKRLEGELESTKLDRDSWSDQSDEFAKTAADLIIRIKRLEEAGDALKAAGYFGGWADAVNKWNKAKEDKT